MRRLPIIILSSFIAFAAVAVVTHAGDSPLPAAQAQSEESAQGITVHGNASVEVEPDQAQLWFGVESAGTTAKAALAANAAEMRKLLDALRAAGATDLQTQHVSLSPRYVEIGPVDAGGGKVGTNGYTAHNSVSATVKQLSRAGTVIDAAVAAGANHVSGPTLTVADPSDVYREALEAAVADARENAEALADAADLTLGRVTAVVEGSDAPSPLPMAARAADEAASTPIEPGTQDISATVTVTFAAS
jgi:uncharacterized protein YggE